MRAQLKLLLPKNETAVWKKEWGSINLLAGCPQCYLSLFLLPTMPLLPAFLLDSLDEVVFEGRNQAYGAYQLRHAYQRNLASAGGITLLLFAFLLLGWAAWRQLAPTAAPVVGLTHEVAPLIPPPSVVIEHPKVAEPQLLHARSAAPHPARTISHEVVKDNIIQPRPTPTPLAEVLAGPVGPATANASDALLAPGEAGSKTGG